MLPKIEMTRYIKSPKVLPMVENTSRYPDFAQRLAAAMADVGLEVVDIKNELGVTYEMARRYTLGTAMPRAARMKSLAALVRRSPSWLAYGADAHTLTAMGSTHQHASQAPSTTLTTWPLKKSTPERVHALSPAQQRRADDAIDVILKGFESETSNSRPVSPKKPTTLKKADVHR